MNIREQLRKSGGDELVAKYDDAQKSERRMIEETKRLIETVIASGMDEQMTMIASCEAMSEVYAQTVVRTFAKLAKDGKTEDNPAEATICAVRSLAGNLQQAFQDLAAEQEGVGDMIKEAAKKGASA